MTANAVSALCAEVRRALAEAGDPDRAAAVQAYLRSELPCHGVSLPGVRRICRRVFADHPMAEERTWRAAVLELYDGAASREERYAAIELTGHRHYRGYQTPRVLGLYRHLVVRGAWWDLVDPVATGRVGPILRGFPEEVTPTIRAWAVDDDPWLRRTAIICQLGSKADTDVDLLRLALESNLEGSLHGREFFVRKAVGWALRQHARTDAPWVRHFVTEHAGTLSALSRREALKHLGSAQPRQ